MWTARSESLARGRVLRVVPELDAAPVAFAEVLRRWEADADFRTWFNDLLAAAPFAAFRWETPPLTTATADRPFELVLLDSPSLDRPPDRDAFAAHFHDAPDGVVTFPNLGRDALLVVPCPGGPPDAYGHLAAFVRQAPEAQRHALWAHDALERRCLTRTAQPESECNENIAR